MNVRKDTFVSEADGLEISYLEAVPEGQPAGIVQIAHGMCEYKERYLEFMEFLARRGYLCVINDHRGHGASVRGSEDLGYFYEGGAAAMVSDLRQLSLMTKARYGTDPQGRPLPYILIGHSMGSFVVRIFARYYGEEISRLAVVGSPSYLPSGKAGLALCRLVSLLKGPKSHSALLDWIMADSLYEKRFRGEGRRHAWVCSDPEVVERYNSDPLCSYTFTVQGYAELAKLMIAAYGKGEMQALRGNRGRACPNPELPVMFFSGEDDACAVSREKWEDAMENMRKAGFRHVEGKMYPGMRHEILNEKERARVYKDLYRFITGEARS